MHSFETQSDEGWGRLREDKTEITVSSVSLLMWQPQLELGQREGRYASVSRPPRGVAGTQACRPSSIAFLVSLVWAGVVVT